MSSAPKKKKETEEEETSAKRINIVRILESYANLRASTQLISLGALTGGLFGSVASEIVVLQQAVGVARSKERKKKGKRTAG